MPGLGLKSLRSPNITETLGFGTCKNVFCRLFALITTKPPSLWAQVDVDQSRPRMILRFPWQSTFAAEPLFAKLNVPRLCSTSAVGQCSTVEDLSILTSRHCATLRNTKCSRTLLLTQLFAKLSFLCLMLSTYSGHNLTLLTVCINSL